MVPHPKIYFPGHFRALKNQHRDPKGMVNLLLLGVKKRIKSSLYCVVYNVVGQSQIVLGFRFLDQSIVKLVSIEGTSDEVKQKISFVSLTYLKNYLVLYDKKEMPVMEEDFEL